MPKIIPPDHTGTEIYRRHRPACANREHCHCPYYIYGYIRGQRVRESLNTHRMIEAMDRQRRREGPRAPLPERLRAAAELIVGLRADLALLLREAAFRIEELSANQKGQ